MKRYARFMDERSEARRVSRVECGGHPKALWMNQRERREYIVKNIQRNATVRAEDLASALDVSIATIRRDFSSLEGHGRLLRTYGGAVIAPSSTEQSFQQRMGAQQSAKCRIAATVLPVLLEAKSVILDAGTTTACLARSIPKNHSLLVVTNGLSILDELRYRDDIELVGLGGGLRHKNQAFMGDAALDQLSRLQVDVCFLGAFGLDPTVGVTSPTASLAVLKTRMVTSAREAFILVDSSKFHKNFAHVSMIDGPVTIVTDTPPSEHDVQAILDRGWDLMVADDLDGVDTDREDRI